MEFVVMFVIALAISACMIYYKHSRDQRREQCIQDFMPPPEMLDVMRVRYPHLSMADCETVVQALRQFFLAHLRNRMFFMSMPSQVADALWHEFILSTRLYEEFCRRAFGKMLHHTPAHAVGGLRQARLGLRRAWKLICAQERIDPKNPERLPLLFALDATLEIKDGFFYRLDCKERMRRGATLGADGTTGVYCGADLGADFIAGADGGVDLGCGGDAGCGSCGGGCGGCGGGCGGGD